MYNLTAGTLVQEQVLARFSLLHVCTTCVLVMCTCSAVLFCLLVNFYTCCAQSFLLFMPVILHAKLSNPLTWNFAGFRV